MATNKKENPPQPMPQFYPQYVVPAEDEISLLDLWRVLVKRWRLIFSVSVLSVVIAVAYALSLPRTYQSEMHLLPPLQKDLQGIQGIQGIQRIQGIQGIEGVQMKGIEPAEVFSQFQGNLKSKAALKAFFEAEKIIAVLAPERSVKTSEQSVFKIFQGSFHFNADKKDKRIFSVVLDWSDQEQIADLLNRYIETVALQTKADIFGEVRGDLLHNKIILEQAIASKRTMALQRRNDEVARLSEALSIAQVLKIKDYSGPQIITNIRTLAGSIESAESGFNFGSDALSMQIEALNKRKSDDPYIRGLRALQEQLVMNNNKLLALTDNFSVMRVDEKAYRPDFPIKPKKRLIVTLGGMLGLMLGLFAAFFFNFLENNRKEPEAEA